MSPIENKIPTSAKQHTRPGLFLLLCPYETIPANMIFAAGWPCGWAAGDAQQLENNSLPVARAGPVGSKRQFVTCYAKRATY